MRHRWVAATWVIGLVLALVRGVRAEEPYVRRAKDRDAVVRELAARSAECATVLLVFDTATFNPPPGRSEFDADHRYRGDLPAWLAAVASLAGAAKRPLFVAATSSQRPVLVLGDGWKEEIERDLATPWWKTEAFKFEPATKWIVRLLDKTMRAPSTPQASTSMLVLVTGDILPEQTVKGMFDFSRELGEIEVAPDGIPKAVGQPADESWRTKLLPVGAYWDEEKVARILSERSSALFVVAPEARFGDFLPVVEIPDVPWASRPVAPPEIIVGSRIAEDLKERLPEDLKQLLPEERKRLLEDRALRFRSVTPRWCRQYGKGVFFNTDCPSGFGHWPFARAAAATGGRYIFYPYPPGRWLDECPQDAVLMSRLAPELVPKEDYLRAKRNDAALDAICEACVAVVEATPWHDSEPESRQRAPGWMFFRSTNPFTLFDRFPVRDRPVDDIPNLEDKSPRKLKREGEEMARVARRYDHAIGILERAEMAILRGAGGTAHPRSIANLALARFWFEMSAFHLDALAIFLNESARLRQRGYVTYVPTIRMSDCLDGYGGLVISHEDEARYRSDFAPPEYQGKLLLVPDDDPKYRARREVDRVLANLDPRLRERALRMIAAGESVMRRYAKSPWGSVVYYSEAFTFVSEPVPEGAAEFDREGEGVEFLRPTTPRPGSSTGPAPRSG